MDEQVIAGNQRTTKVVDWTARILAWTAVTVWGSVLAVGFGYKLWLLMSDDWGLTVSLIVLVIGWGIIMWAIQRTWHIW